MQLHLLHFDDAFALQPEFVEHCDRNGALHFNAIPEGSAIRLWGKPAKLEHMESRLDEIFINLDEPKLFFMGSGDFHHVTALLLEKCLAGRTDPITVIHFDNHPDWVHCSVGMHCGSWVKRASTHPLIARILTIGVTSNDLTNPEWKGAGLSLLQDGMLELYPYDHKPSRVRNAYGEGASYQQTNGHIHWKTIAGLGEEAFLELFLTRIPTRDVYMTIDKDVLCREDAETNWDQGTMSLAFLLKMIRAVGTNHHIIGADVTGDYSPPNYTGNFWTRLMKRAEILLDQPTLRTTPQKAGAVNTLGNLALLETLQELMD